MYKHLYRHFLEARPGELHFAAHSHHPWPDVTRAAQLACWDEAAHHWDDKWPRLFEVQLPALQRAVAAQLGSNTPQQLVFAPNTHELVQRLLSCLPLEPPPTVLTTDGEFHSLDRQLRRLEEAGCVRVRRLASLPIATLAARMIDALSRRPPDLLIFSQVFFDSGLVVTELASILAAAPARTLVAIDGYHAFMALPLALDGVLPRAFYLAGGYKYAQAGEGCCFMHVPEGEWRPRDTGWFADFDGLEQRRGAVGYGAGGRCFAGATFDPCGLYRLQAVLGLLAAEGIDVPRIHRHVQKLQAHFLARLDRQGHPLLRRERLLWAPDRVHGHFFCFDLGAPAAARLQQRLRRRGVWVDRRGGRLRIGFGLYQERGDVDLFFERLGTDG